MGIAQADGITFTVHLVKLSTVLRDFAASRNAKHIFDTQAQLLPDKPSDDRAERAADIHKRVVDRIAERAYILARGARRRSRHARLYHSGSQCRNHEDRKQFHRDLAMYTDFDVRKELAASVRKKGKTQEEEAPFVARVALLLDPSMLEQARRAARKFHGGMGVVARKLLRQTLSPGRR